METHIKIIGTLNVVFGFLGLMAAAIVFVAVAGGGLLSGDPQAMTITSIVAVSVSGFITLLSIPGIVAGVGILRSKNWGRILGVVVAILDLFNIPIGTAFGIYALWVLMNEETEKYFRERQPGGIVVEQG